jgi:hypothetical protein
MTNRYHFPGLASFSYIVATIFIGLGFYKMLVYSNSDTYPYKSVNAYVGGDAYNYIINSNYAGAFFTLALIFVLLGSTIAIIKGMEYLAEIGHLNHPQEPTEANPVQFQDLPKL